MGSQRSQDDLMAKPNRCSSAVHQVIYSRPCRLGDRGLFRNVVYGVAYLFVRFFYPSRGSDMWETRSLAPVTAAGPDDLPDNQ